MSRIPRRANDARLSRDGTVKFGGINVGFWWRDGNDLYHFDFKRTLSAESGWGIVQSAMRHELMSAIAEHLERVGRMPTLTKP